MNGNGKHTPHAPGFDEREAILDARAAEIVNNIVSGRQMWIDRLTRGMDPRRDISKECGYPQSGAVDAWKYQELYDREPIAGRVVEVMPKQSWQVQPRVYETEDGDEPTAFEKAWDGLAKQLRGKSWYKDEEGSPVWEYLLRADILSGIGHYGVIFIGLNDGIQDLTQPAKGVEEVNSKPTPINKDLEEQLISKGTEVPKHTVVRNASGVYKLTVNEEQQQGRKITMLRALPETQCQVVQWEQNPTSPRYGQPAMYLMYFADPQQDSLSLGQPMSGQMVHWTRVLHIADTWHHASANECIAAPRIKPVLNPVLDIIKVRGASAEGFWQQAFSLLSFETHPQLGVEASPNPTEMKDLFERVQNGLQRAFWTVGQTAKSIAPNVSDPTPHIAISLEAICIKLEMPIRIFKGSERGELASSQDDESWNDRVQGRQLYYNTPRIVIPFIDRLIMLGVLPEPTEIEEKEVVDEEAQAKLQAGEGTQDEEAFGEIDTEGDVPTKPPAKPPMGAKKPGVFNSRRTFKRRRLVTRAVYNAMVANGFCATGEGGGIDPTCGNTESRPMQAAMDTYKRVGGDVDGRRVLKNIDNTDSIASSLNDYRSLPGIREVKISDFPGLTGKSYSVSETERIKKLAEKIKTSGKISPLIVVDDGDPQGPYILEGGHRAEALKLMGAKSFPALVVLDKESIRDRIKKGTLADRLKKKATTNITANDFPPFGKPSSVPNPPTDPMMGDEEAAEDPEDMVEIEEEVEVPTKCIRTEAGYCIEWPDITSMGALDKATVFSTKMTGLSAAISGGVAQLIGEHKILTEYGMDDEEAEAALEQGVAAAEEQMGMDQQLMDEQGFIPDASAAGMVDPEQRDMDHEVEMAKAKNGGGSPFDKGGAPPFPPKPGAKKPPFTQNADGTVTINDEEMIENWCNQYGGDTCKDGAKNEATKERLKKVKESLKGKKVDKSKVKGKVKEKVAKYRGKTPKNEREKMKDEKKADKEAKDLKDILPDFDKIGAKLDKEKAERKTEKDKEWASKSIFRKAWDALVGNAGDDEDEVSDAITALVATAEEQAGRDLTDDEVDELVEEFLNDSDN